MPDQRAPKPDQIRDLSQATRGWGWVDHRIRWFWDDMTQHELLLYFFLSASADRDGCCWPSTRQMTRALKIGPASVIKARQMLEERNLLACRKDEFSQRIIFQLLPLPIQTNESVEIPMKKTISRGTKKTTDSTEAPTEEQFAKNLEYLSNIKKMLDE